MAYIDIHSHVFFSDNKEIDKFIENSKKSKVNIILDNGLNPETNRKVLKLAEKYIEIKPCLGMYPIDALKLSEREIQNEIEFIRKNKNKIYAIGEIGLDCKTESRIKTLDEQEKIFRRFIELGIELNKPVIIHSRKAEKQVIEILEEYSEKLNNKIIMHCFSGKKRLVKKIIINKWFLTIPTNVKYSEQFQIIIKECPIEQLFCETDTPYLHPEKIFPNEPGNVIESYKKISEIKNLELEDVEKKIQDNFNKLFNKKT